MSNTSHLKAADRNRIARSLQSSDMLGGNEKVAKLATALSVVTDHLSELGFSLDVVSSDILMGDKGSRQLPFRLANDTEDPFFEHPRIENSFIIFVWENLARVDEDARFEILAYVS